MIMNNKGNNDLSDETAYRMGKESFLATHQMGDLLFRKHKNRKN